MKSKGFSLIELLAVITILAIIALITVPIANRVIKEIREKAEASQEKLVIEGAKIWVSQNSNLLSDEVGDIYTLEVQTIQNSNYLTQKQLKDLEKSKDLDNACVKITTEEHRYSYQFVKECE